MRYEGELKIIFGASAFALIPVFAILGKDLSVYSLLLGRLASASIILFLMVKNKNELFSISWIKILKLTGWSLLMLGAMITYFMSIHISGMAVSAAILGTLPFFIVVFSALFLKESISAKTWMASLICLIGIVLIAGWENILYLKSISGVLLALISALFLSFNFLYKKKYLNEFSGVRLVFYQSLFQIPFLFPFVIYFPGTLTSYGILSSFLLGLICTVVSYVLIYDGIKKVKAQQIGILQSVENILPVFIGILFYNEKLSILAMTGVFLIILSTFLITFKTRIRF